MPCYGLHACDPQPPPQSVRGNLIPKKTAPSFSDYKMHFPQPPTQIWEENGGASYSLNVAYIYIGEILRYLCY